MDPSDLPFDPVPDTAVLVGVQRGRALRADTEESLAELAQLAGTAGGEVLDTFLFRGDPIQAGSFIGTGQAQEVADRVADLRASMVIFDDDLSPAQGRNLEKVMQVRVLDRTQLILDIFAQRAQTREGCLQIELAQLEYLKPRLRRMWTHLERQKGGIGLRGPGETQLEVDRRRIDQRLARLKKELEVVRGRRAEQRRGRRRGGWALISLVGYTNAGKSTLFNRLTGASILAMDKLFATLDPTTRKVDLPNHQSVLITDTVGFIRKLPHHLVDSFRATLEEVVEADLLLHVVDHSHPHADHQMAAVNEVLQEIGAGGKDQVLVFNKVDLAPRNPVLSRHDEERDGLGMVRVSAVTGEGVEDLVSLIIHRLRDRFRRVRLAVPAGEGRVLAALKASAQVLKEEYDGDLVRIEASIPSGLEGICQPYLEGAAAEAPS